MNTITCPTNYVPSFPEPWARLILEGCGSTNVIGPDDEGLYDCCDCGLWFTVPWRPARIEEESNG